MKKLLCILLVTLLVASFCGCTKTGEVPVSNDNPATASTSTDHAAATESDSSSYDATIPYHSLTIEELGKHGLLFHHFVSGDVDKNFPSYYYVFQQLTSLNYEEFEQYLSSIYLYDNNGYPYIPAHIIEQYLTRCFAFTQDDIRNALGNYNSQLDAYPAPEGIGGGQNSVNILSTKEEDGIHTVTLELYDLDSGVIFGTSTVTYRTVGQENQYISCDFNPK